MILHCYRVDEARRDQAAASEQSFGKPSTEKEPPKPPQSSQATQRQFIPGLPDQLLTAAVTGGKRTQKKRRKKRSAVPAAAEQVCCLYSCG
jgi:hypothetical protein